MACHQGMRRTSVSIYQSFPLGSTPGVGSLCWLCFQGMVVKLSKPPGLAQPLSAVPALPQALTALGFNWDFFWALCPLGLSQTPLCCLFLLQSDFLAIYAFLSSFPFIFHSHLSQ